MSDDGEHRMTLFTSRIDEQIYLTCTCGWDTSLGYSPTPIEVSEAAEAHHRRPSVTDKEET